MASRPQDLFKFPRRAEKTEESNPSNKEKQRSVWSPGTRVVGKYDFKGETADDLPFRKGEILVIEGVTGPNWFEAVNCEGRKGWIPRNFVMERYPVELKPMSWFHGNISRIEAERLFYPCEDGMFLIRNFTKHQGDYVLSVCYANEIKHYRIQKTDDGKYIIAGGVFLRSLFEFVEVRRVFILRCRVISAPVHCCRTYIYVTRSRQMLTTRHSYHEVMIS